MCLTVIEIVFEVQLKSAKLVPNWFPLGFYRISYTIRAHSYRFLLKSPGFLKPRRLNRDPGCPKNIKITSFAQTAKTESGPWMPEKP